MVRSSHISAPQGKQNYENAYFSILDVHGGCSHRRGDNELGRAAKSPLVRIPVSIYVETFLALPVLVLLIWIYYCGPLLLNIRLSSFWTAVVALTLSLGAFVAEIVRSGLLSVPRGQVEAARALGMTPLQALVYIEFPEPH
ncbi:MAG: ABC transporter permease subunit [Verrucomicrobiota bacterium]|jgi:polar amino acid transport system permease protein